MEIVQRAAAALVRYRRETESRRLPAMRESPASRSRGGPAVALLLAMFSCCPALSQLPANGFPSPAAGFIGLSSTDRIVRDCDRLILDGRLADAEMIMEKAVAESVRRGWGIVDRGRLVAARGFVRKLLGKYTEAARDLRHALAVLGPESEAAGVTEQVWLSLASLYAESGQYGAARGAIRQGLAERYRLLDGEIDDTFTAQLCNIVAALRRVEGRPQESLHLYQKALGVFDRGGLRYAAERAITLNNMGTLHLHLGEINTAKSLLQRSLVELHSITSHQHPLIGKVIFNIAVADFVDGRYGAAEERFIESLRILRSSLGDGHLFLVEPLVARARNLRKLDRGREAKQIEREARRIAAANRASAPRHAIHYEDWRTLQQPAAEQGATH